MRKPALIALTLMAAVPAGFLCYVAILGIMAYAQRQQFTSGLAIVLYITAVCSGMIVIWPPLWAIVWYGSPAKAAESSDAGSDEEAIAGEAESDEDDEAMSEKSSRGDEEFPEDDLDAFEGQPPPKDDDDDTFEAVDDDLSQDETDDFQLDDDEFGDLDFDEEAEEEEAPKAKSKAKDKAKKKKK